MTIEKFCHHVYSISGVNGVLEHEHCASFKHIEDAESFMFEFDPIASNETFVIVSEKENE